uniref:KRAB domain-containing protein n=1 Tax=Pelusios castaneus TaxID=367368 RepID=A0A8C8RQQ5_9SAUR
MPVTFEDVAVRFSAEEWEILEGWQKELHKEVMEKNYQLLISLGQSVPALALLSLTEEREAGGDQIPIIAGEQDLARDGGRSAGEELAFADGDPDVGQLWDSGRSGEDGCPTPAGEEERQGSLHLSALMKLVEEIPEFLFGNSKGSVEPADSEAEMGAEEASADEIAAENSHLQGLLSCLKEIPVNGAPHPSMQNCSRQGDMEQESREREMKGCCAPVKREVTTERSPSKELTGAVALSPRYPSTPASSARGDADKRRREPGLWKCSYEAAMAGNSPLQGLLNCLKDRIVHKPQHALPSPCKPPRGSAHRDPGQRRPASKDGSSSAAGAAAGSSSGRALPACGFSGSSSQGPETQLWGRPAGVKAKVVPKDPLLRSLENCLTDEARNSAAQPPPSHSSSSAVLRALGETPRRGTRSLFAEVKTEAGMEDSHLLSYLKDMATLSPHHHSTPPRSAPASCTEQEKEQRRVEAGLWNSSPEEVTPGTCLKEVPIHTPCASQVLASKTGADMSPRRPEARMMQWRCGAEVSPGNSPLHGLKTCLTNTPVPSHGQSTTPASHSPGSGSPDPRRPEAAAWPVKTEGQRRVHSVPVMREAVPENPPLHGLGGCWTGIASHSGSPARCIEGDVEQWTPETGAWPSCADRAVSGLTPPLCGLENCLKDISGNRPRGSSATASYFCTSRAQGDAEQRGPVTRPQRAGAAAANMASSPLDGLMKCLKEISASRLGFTSTPSGCSSASSAEGDSDLRGAKPGTWSWGSDEISPENSPLQGLEKCLEEISGPGPRTSSIPVTRAVAGSQQGDMPQRRPEMGDWDFHGADTRQVLTANGHLQGPENCLAEIAAPRSSPSQAPSSSAREDAQQGRSAHVRPSGNRGEPGNLEVPALSGSELATEHLALPQKEITAARQTPSSSPAHCSSPAGSVQGDGTLKRPEVRSRKLSRKDPRAETPRLHGPETCQSEVPGPRGSRPDTPLGSSSSSPQRDVGERSPQPGRCRLHRDVLPADAFRCGLSPCPKGARESGPCHSNTLSGTSFASDASDQRRPRTPEKGIKRPYPKARTGAGRSPNTDSCTSGDDGGQKVDAEWEELPKRTCSSATPSSWGPCSCEGGKPLDPNREISAIKAILSEKLDQISQDLAAMRRDVSNIQSRMDRLDWDSRGWALELAALQKSNKCLSETMRRLENRCLVLENRSRRNSLRLAGLPEGSEGGDPITFLQRTLPIVLNLPVDSPPLEVESARRVHGGARWDPSTRPRALVFRLLRFSDKLTIMRAVRKCTEPLSCGGARVAIFPDICPKLGWRRRARCAAIRRLWRAAELHFGP